MAQLASVPESAPVPPQNLEAEESVLGAMMLSPGAVAACREVLQPDGREFYRESHARIWRAALWLTDAGEPVDAITLTDRLEETSELEDAGGRSRLYELAGLVPATSNASHYAKIVAKTFLLRGLIRAGGEISQIGWSYTDDVDAAFDKARGLFQQLEEGGLDTASAFRVVSLEDFVNVKEDTSAPLIGASSDDSLLPADGLLLMYGDGGAGKTTLSIDALAHLASGTTWLDNAIPRAANALLIENEGPRGPFRELLEKKKAKWAGHPFAARVRVLEEPWTQFTLDDASYRTHLAQEIADNQIDIVIVGPLASLGAKGTGTPDDVNDFSAMISDLRSRAGRPFALWIVHHENKAGDVSGAWERLPDTLVHVSAQGNGRTRVHWRKVRWSSRLHNTSVQLLWNEGGFTLEEARIRELPVEILEAFEKDDRWRTARESAGLVGANQDKVREALQQLVIEGKMLHQIGPAGRSATAKCWKLRTDSDPPSHPESLDLFEGGGNGTDSVTPPTRGVTRVSHTTSTPPTDSDPPGQVTPPAHPDEIEWDLGE